MAQYLVDFITEVTSSNVCLFESDIWNSKMPLLYNHSRICYTDIFWVKKIEKHKRILLLQKTRGVASSFVQRYTSWYTNMFLKEHFQLFVMEMLSQAHMWILRVSCYLSNYSVFTFF